MWVNMEKFFKRFLALMTVGSAAVAGLYYLRNRPNVQEYVQIGDVNGVCGETPVIPKNDYRDKEIHYNTNTELQRIRPAGEYDPQKEIGVC